MGTRFGRRAADGTFEDLCDKTRQFQRGVGNRWSAPAGAGGRHSWIVQSKRH